MRESISRLQLLFVAVAMAATFLTPAAAQGGAAPAAVDFAAVEFLPGRWVGELGGGTIEEQWSEPVGDNMIGMFRYVKEGAGSFYEFMLIERTESGLVLRLRHFSPRLIGWEEKDAPLVFELTDAAPGRAVFQQTDELTRLVFESHGADALSITLEKLRDGEVVPQVFRFRRGS